MLGCRLAARSANRWRIDGQGALRRSHADIVVSVTDVAGPGDGNVETPVGLVGFGLEQRGGTVASARPGNWTAIRVAAVEDQSRWSARNCRIDRFI